jgi:hypothetical protein
MTVRFDQALPIFINWLEENTGYLPPKTRGVVVRDLRGQLRLIAERPNQTQSPTTPLDPRKAFFDKKIEELLGPYKSPGSFTINLGPDEGFRSFFDAPDSYACPGYHPNLKILDRLATGREWLYPANVRATGAPRVVFHGLKGGVGRSTALSMVAWHLAQQGKRVLVIDLDLEAPGLGNMLLPVRNDLHEDGDTAIPGWPSYGMVDWFVEDAVGGVDSDLLRMMIQPSPINIGGKGEIYVVPAAGGLYDQDYVSKLSRAYIDIADQTGGAEVFGDRLTRGIQQLEDHLAPDVILLDSRAGIHHISATALTRLSTFSYLFASDSEQTWAGYGALFNHWKLNIDNIQRIRTTIRLVSALTPSGVDKDKFRDAYGENSFNTFVQLYDDEPTANSDDELFSFGVFEEDAPHRPVLIWRDEVYANFNPLNQTLQLDSEKAVIVFEELFSQIDRDLKSRDPS